MFFSLIAFFGITMLKDGNKDKHNKLKWRKIKAFSQKNEDFSENMRE